MEYNNFTVDELIVEVVGDLLFLYGSEFENIPGKEITRGIDIFNRIISENNIPILWREYTNTIAGQAIYGSLDLGILPGLREVQAVGILIDNLWYPLKELTQSEVDRNVTDFVLTGSGASQGRPAYYLFNKNATTAGRNKDEDNSITLYPIPDAQYEMKVTCRLSQPTIVSQDNVTDTLLVTPEWEKFLVYAMGHDIKDYHTKAKWTPAMEAEYKRLKGMVAWKYNDDTATATDSALTNYWGWGTGRGGRYRW